MAEPNIPNLTSTQQIQRAESMMVAAYRSGITDPKELANFMGQVQHESLNFTRLEENLNYSGSRLYDVFPGRNGLTRDGAQAIVNIADRTERHQAVAEQVYGGAWGARRLGNTEPGDAYTYRGRGFMQLTGRGNYAAYGAALELDLLHHPELAATERNSERIVTRYWDTAVRPIPGARTDVTKAGSIINTGAIGGVVKGLADRQANAAAWEAALGKEGYLESVLERHPAAPTAIETPAPTPASAPAMQQGALEEPLRLRPELQLSPESLRLLQGSEQQVRQIAERHQLPWDAGLDNTVAAVASQARQAGLSNITHLNVTEGGQIRLAQFDGLTLKESSLDARAAANTAQQHSLGQMAQLDEQRQQKKGEQLQMAAQIQPSGRNESGDHFHNANAHPNRTPEAPALSV